MNVLYVNVHPHLGSYASLPGYWYPHGALGVRGMANLQDGPGAVSVREWQGQESAAHGRKRPWVSQCFPSVTHPAGLIRAFQPDRVSQRPVLVDPAPEVLEEQSLMGSNPSSITSQVCKANTRVNFFVPQFCPL